MSDITLIYQHHYCILPVFALDIKNERKGERHTGARAAVLLHDHKLIGFESQSPERAVERQHPLTVWKCQHNLCTSPPASSASKAEAAGFCYFWQSGLTSRHFSLCISWDWKCKGHSHVHLEPVLLKTEVALCADCCSQALQPREQQACCVALLLPQILPGSIRPRSGPCSRWMSLPDHTKQTTFHLLDF